MYEISIAIKHFKVDLRHLKNTGNCKNFNKMDYI